jgi:hypothetical protein
MFRAPCAHCQEVKIVLYSLWHHHTETSEWSKITKITKVTEIYKYEHIVVKFLCEFFTQKCHTRKIHTHTSKNKKETQQPMKTDAETCKQDA